MKNLFPLLLLMAVFCACQKKKEETPQPTITGKNELYFFKGDVFYKYSGWYNGGPSIWVMTNGINVYNGYTPGYPWTVSIYATDIEEYNDKLSLYIPYHIAIRYTQHARTDTVYKLSNTLNISTYIDYNKPDSLRTYIADTTKCTVRFTWHDEFITAGEFYFYGTNKAGETVELTRGIFDLRNNEW